MNLQACTSAELADLLYTLVVYVSSYCMCMFCVRACVFAGFGLGGGLGGLGGGLGAGMIAKFEPVSGTDTVNKNGITTTVNTKLHCISGMKQYETQSLEVRAHTYTYQLHVHCMFVLVLISLCQEIRLADYQAGRKGSTGGGLSTGLSLGGGLMGNQSTGGLGGGKLSVLCFLVYQLYILYVHLIIQCMINCMSQELEELPCLGRTNHWEEVRSRWCDNYKASFHTGLATGGLFSQSSQQSQLGGLATNTSTTGGLLGQQQPTGGGLFGTLGNTLGGGLATNTGEIRTSFC